LLHFNFSLPVSRCVKKRFPKALSLAHMKGNFYIVEDSQLFKKSNILKGSGDTQSGVLIGPLPGNISVVKVDTATGGFENAGKQIKHGGLASPIGSDQADQFSMVDLDAIVCQGGDAAEAFF